ncbi:MAG: transglutaminase family protein [Nitriliruptoraceae bacterium]
MRLNIHYTTRFDYEQAVSESQNELRACPATDEHQQLVHYHVTTTPSSRVLSYLDYWGTRVDTFGVRMPHHSLEVSGHATVETTLREHPQQSVPLLSLDDDQFRDNHLELLQHSPHVVWGKDIAAAARTCAMSGGDDVLAVVHAVNDYVAAMSYRRGATYVGVGVDQIHEAGAGVCQDFAHLAIAMYRELSIPARYVSGYLFTADDSTGQDVTVDEVEVETHAWVEVAIPTIGWFALDPTNNQIVNERHVTIGRGRDYDDVAPLRGAFSGPRHHELDVSVTMRRLAVEVQGVGVFGGGRSAGSEPRWVDVQGTQQQQQQQQ